MPSRHPAAALALPTPARPAGPPQHLEDIEASSQGPELQPLPVALIGAGTRRGEADPSAEGG